MKSKELGSQFKIVNKKIVHILKNGINLSTLICLFAVYFLTIYCETSIPQSFYIGISLLKSALFFITMFIICGFVFDRFTAD